MTHWKKLIAEKKLFADVTFNGNTVTLHLINEYAKPEFIKKVANAISNIDLGSKEFQKLFRKPKKTNPLVLEFKPNQQLALASQVIDALSICALPKKQRAAAKAQANAKAELKAKATAKAANKVKKTLVLQKNHGYADGNVNAQEVILHDEIVNSPEIQDDSFWNFADELQAPLPPLDISVASSHRDSSSENLLTGFDDIWDSSLKNLFDNQAKSVLFGFPLLTFGVQEILDESPPAFTDEDNFLSYNEGETLGLNL